MRKFLIIFFCLLSLTLLADPPAWQPISGTQYSMILFARIVLNGDYFELTGSNMAAAFGPGGETDCRDIAGWENGTPNGFWYFNIVGNQNGEAITFKIYDEDSDLVYDCDQTLIFQDNSTIGSPSDPYLLSIDSNLISGNLTLLTITPPAGNITEIEISNGTYSVHPASNGYYELPAVPGTYNITASLSGYNTATITDVEVVQGQNTEDIDFTLIDWEPLSGTQYSMVVMCEVYFGSEQIVFDGTNQIGAFGPGGESDCRGVAVWQEANPPYWDGYWFMTIVGNTQNQEINFRVFESSTSAVYDCWETVTFSNNSTLGTPQSPITFNIDFSINQTLDLGENWNWISFYVHPVDTAVSAVFGSLGANIYQVKNQTHSATYFEASQTWLGSLSEIADGEAYLVHMYNAVDDFVVNGEPISISTPIDLTEGWNWIAYYPRTIMDLEAAMHSIEENVIQIKSQSQTANFINPPGSWVGDLIQMEPDQGYKIFMNNEDELIYEESDIITKNEGNYTDDPPAWSIISGTEYSMVVMASITFEGEEFNNSGSNLVGAFGPDGETDCRSVGVWQPANPPYYENGFWYFTVVGNDNGEDISFMIYDETTDNTYTCNEIIPFQSDETYGSPTEPYQLTAQIIGTENKLIDSSTELTVFPNPFNPSTTIQFNLTAKDAKNAKIEIYNIKGQKVKQLVSDQLSASQHSIVWDGTDDNNKPVSSGIYFCKLKNGKLPKIRKMLLIK